MNDLIERWNVFRSVMKFTSILKKPEILSNARNDTMASIKEVKSGGTQLYSPNLISAVDRAAHGFFGTRAPAAGDDIDRRRSPIAFISPETCSNRASLFSLSRVMYESEDDTWRPYFGGLAARCANTHTHMHKESNDSFDLHAHATAYFAAGSYSKAKLALKAQRPLDGSRFGETEATIASRQNYP